LIEQIASTAAAVAAALLSLLLVIRAVDRQHGAQTHCSNRPENLFTSRLRGGNLTLIFLIAAHSNHFSSCSIHFSHAARFSETISGVQVFALLFSLALSFCDFLQIQINSKRCVCVSVPTGASAEEQIKSSVIIMADQFL